MNRKPRWGRKAAAVLLSASLLIPVLSACSGGNDNSKADKNKETILRIASGYGYIGEGGEGFREWTEIFEFTHPNVKLEFVETMPQQGMPEPGEEYKPEDPMKHLKDALTGPNPPDLIMLGMEQMPELIDENLLAPLDPFITKDKFDTEAIVPAVIEGLKDMGDGTLYALAPQFGASAMIYNKDLFDAAGIDYPVDEMTWDQVFDLARRLTKADQEKPQHGFAFSTWQGGDGFWETQMYTAPLELSIFDETGENVLVDTPDWQDAWETMIKLRTDKVTPTPPDYSKPMPEPIEYNPVEHDNFLSGKVAMAVADYGYINQVIQHNKMAEKGQKGYNAVNWDIVTVPVHESVPGVGGNIYLNGIFAINAKAQNEDAAWEFIKFINSEDWARAKSRASWNMVAHKKFIQPKEGLDYNVEAFTKLKPVPVNNMWNNPIFREIPRAWEIQQIGANKYMEAMNGTKTVEQALKEWQTEGQALLKQLRENPDAPIQTFDDEKAQMIEAETVVE